MPLATTRRRRGHQALLLLSRWNRGGFAVLALAIGVWTALDKKASICIIEVVVDGGVHPLKVIRIVFASAATASAIITIVGIAPVVSRGVPMVSRWCPGGFRVAPGGVPVVPRW